MRMCTIQCCCTRLVTGRGSIHEKICPLSDEGGTGRTHECFRGFLARPRAALLADVTKHHSPSYQGLSGRATTLWEVDKSVKGRSHSEEERVSAHS